MIYELFEGFSEGFMAGIAEDDLNEHLATMGVTIVYTPSGRRVFIDDSVNSGEADYYISTHQSEPVEVDWEAFRRDSIRGYGALHPYYAISGGSKNRV